MLETLLTRWVLTLALGRRQQDHGRIKWEKKIWEFCACFSLHCLEATRPCWPHSYGYSRSLRSEIKTRRSPTLERPWKKLRETNKLPEVPSLGPLHPPQINAGGLLPEVQCCIVCSRHCFSLGTKSHGLICRGVPGLSTQASFILPQALWLPRLPTCKAWPSSWNPQRKLSTKDKISRHLQSTSVSKGNSHPGLQILPGTKD